MLSHISPGVPGCRLPANLVLAVNATTVTTERAWCPRLGDRPAFEESSFFLEFTFDTGLTVNKLYRAIDEIGIPESLVFEKDNPVMKELIEGVCSAVMISIKEIFTFEEMCRAYTYLLEKDL
ncbi:hypothetical protein FOZ62_025766 [Perkinsus olseni]|uniref:Uncharacterized protein n=1 Tax=Perkinsus olseni TaxID=32597 RepID=A0A7J6S244_PEROL|nr:hypothetical protein FOZ62_025766 [Perkinsus olseni]